MIPGCRHRDGGDRVLCVDRPHRSRGLDDLVDPGAAARAVGCHQIGTDRLDVGVAPFEKLRRRRGFGIDFEDGVGAIRTSSAKPSLHELGDAISIDVDERSVTVGSITQTLHMLEHRDGFVMVGAAQIHDKPSLLGIGVDRGGEPNDRTVAVVLVQDIRVLNGMN